MSHTRIDPAKLFAKQTASGSLDDGCVVDVRTGAEVSSEALPGAIHIPLHELTCERLQSELAKHGKTQATTLYLLCQSGKRAETAANQLRGQVSQALCVIDGGMNAVKQTAAPIQIGGHSSISLERQVRIAAGILVMTGVALGFLVSPGFYALAGLVGAGLTFAGITDTCAMGLVIARMPWNR